MPEIGSAVFAGLMPWFSIREAEPWEGLRPAPDTADGQEPFGYEGAEPLEEGVAPSDMKGFIAKSILTIAATRPVKMAVFVWTVWEPSSANVCLGLRERHAKPIPTNVLSLFVSTVAPASTESMATHAIARTVLKGRTAKKIAITARIISASMVHVWMAPAPTRAHVTMAGLVFSATRTSMTARTVPVRTVSVRISSVVTSAHAFRGGPGSIAIRMPMTALPIPVLTRASVSTI